MPYPPPPPPPPREKAVCLGCKYLDPGRGTNHLTWLCNKTTEATDPVTGKQTVRRYRCVDRNTGNCRFYKKAATKEEILDYLIGKRPWMTKLGRFVEWIDPIIFGVTILFLLSLAACMAFITWIVI